MRPPAQTASLTIAMLVALVAAPAAAADPDGQTRPEVTIRTVQPDPVSGRLASFSLKEGVKVVTEDGERRIPTADLVRIAFDVSPREQLSQGPEGTPLPDLTTFTLAGGDVISGRVADSRDNAVIVQTHDLGEVTLSMEALSQIITAQGAGPAHRDSVQWFFRTLAKDEDAVLLANGDVLRGFIAGIDAEGLSIDGVTGPVKAAFRLVLAAQIAHPPPIPPLTPYAVVHLRDSGRLTVTSLDCDDTEVNAQTQSSGSVHFRLDRLAAIDVSGGRWVWLTELRPVSFEQVPMLSLGWDFAVNKNVRGGPITVDGQRYEHGIGVHSRSVLIYELDAAYREFVTSFGMDDDSGPLADVNATILVDGQRRFEKLHVRRGTLVGPIRLDVSRAGRIELVVDFGDNGDVQDRFDWIEPALIR